MEKSDELKIEIRRRLGSIVTLVWGVGTFINEMLNFVDAGIEESK